MSEFPKRRLFTRAPRVTLRGGLTVTIRLENGKQVSAKLHKLSVTGGLLETSDYLEERVRVAVTLPIGAGFLNPKAELLFPRWSASGYLQPFRFTSLWAEERQILEMEITELLNLTVARSALNPRLCLPPQFRDSI
jgi:hypothetical protein